MGRSPEAAEQLRALVASGEAFAFDPTDLTNGG
jgi:hypothetical protein